MKVGDTLVDIQEGKNFGCWTVGILEGSNLLGLTEEQTKNIDKEILNEKKRIIRKKFEDIGADVIIERIGDLPVAVDQINRLLASGGYPGGFHRVRSRKNLFYSLLSLFSSSSFFIFFFFFCSSFLYFRFFCSYFLYFLFLIFFFFASSFCY